MNGSGVYQIECNQSKREKQTQMDLSYMWDIKNLYKKNIKSRMAIEMKSNLVRCLPLSCGWRMISEEKKTREMEDWMW